MGRREFASQDEVLAALHIKVIPNFFYESLLRKLIEMNATLPDRKTLFERDENDGFPYPLSEAVVWASSVFGTAGLNRAVMKRYLIGESSGAFELHQDPPEYQGHIFLMSLTGRANLDVVNYNLMGGGQITIDCAPNTAVAVPSYTWHDVSPPREEYGMRQFLFLGHACPNIPEDYERPY